MEVNQPAVSKILQVLAERGAVSVHADDRDARRRTVWLADEGRRLCDQAMEAMHPEATLALDVLDDERLGVFLELLGDVRDQLNSAHR
jgi:DNA-binding MarR family transcriptional regulator